MSIRKELPKTYDPKASESKLYQFWMDGGFFNAEVDPNKKPFSIMLPPPNVTGQLHMGHAFDNTLQDILIRAKRMQGYAALWMPGTDHAGLATQIKVEEILRQKGETRFDYGREKFLELCWDWKEQYGSRIINQLKTLGSSCDWRRLRFTYDEGMREAVEEVFVSLYNKGLIYKGYRSVNWCPHCSTALSDVEVEYEEQPGHLWHVRYPIEGSDSEYIIIATTRPETMMGDSGIAVHPEDERYQHLIGKNAILPLMNRPIPIFADEYVEKEFGTGCVKVTPCHDPNDFEMGNRHGLEFINIFNNDATVNENGGQYVGMTRENARKAVVKDLEEQGYLVKTEDYKHNVGTCQRCHTNVEAMASTQWFVKMGPLAEPAIEVVKNGQVKFVPERFSKTYMNWMENIHDWCISRQIWWGHRIPAYYCEKCGHMVVKKGGAPAVCEKCGHEHFRQEEDALDTWFSSALWPFATLGWPKKTPELDYFYPTNVLVTGYDIIFFWVARMIFSGMESMGEKPFSDVFIHGIIRDNQGRKMSKSLGNGIDPLQIIDQYGADALRFTLVTGIGPGNDARFYTERVEANRNFCNKIWNASRFLMMNLEVEDFTLPAQLDLEDKWILSKYNTLVKEVTDNLDKYELGIAADKLYSFIWDYFCDWYIELCKTRLTGEDKEASVRAQKVLGHILSGTMQLLHPFMPFITEEIWQALPHEGPSIMVSQWPKADDSLNFPAEEQEMEEIMAAIRAVRNRRSEMNVPPSKKAALIIATQKPALFAQAEPFMKKLAWASQVTVQEAPPAEVSGMVTCVTQAAQIYMPLSELVDLDKERERLQKELDNALNMVKRTEGKLSNESFVARAPEAVVNAEKEKLEKYREMAAKLEENLKALGK